MFVFTIRTCARGKVDIFEGVNHQMPNLSSLHTSPRASWSTLSMRELN